LPSERAIPDGPSSKMAVMKRIVLVLAAVVGVAGERPPLTERFERVSGKDALVKARKESPAYCDQV
jgi:hypothetical protein